MLEVTWRATAESAKVEVVMVRLMKTSEAESAAVKVPDLLN